MVVLRALAPGLLNVGRVAVEPVEALAAMVTQVEVQGRSRLPTTRNFPPQSR